MKLITIIALSGAVALLDACGNQREHTKRATDSHADDWVVDPRVPGPDLPQAGRSLFDYVVGDAPPFLFPATLRKIEEHLGHRRAASNIDALQQFGGGLIEQFGAPQFLKALQQFGDGNVPERAAVGNVTDTTTNEQLLLRQP